MKSLNNVQKISKVLMILSKIVFVCAIVGCALCTISIPIIAVYFNNPEIMRLLATYDVQIGYNQAVCSCVCGAIECGFVIALYVFVVKFYNLELKIGTPFNNIVATKMRKLGWLHIILPIASMIVVAIVSVCFKVDATDMISGGNLTLGIVYLIVSFVLKYGAEINQANESIEVTKKENVEINKES